MELGFWSSVLDFVLLVLGLEYVKRRRTIGVLGVSYDVGKKGEGIWGLRSFVVCVWI